MSEQQQPNAPFNLGQWFLDNLPFCRIFKGFRSAAQPGKLILGVVGILVFLLIGWFVDLLTPSVVVRPNDNAPAQTELDIYAAATEAVTRDDFFAMLQRHRDRNNDLLRACLVNQPISLAATAADNAIRDGEAEGKIEDKYEECFRNAISVLEARYEARVSAIINEAEKSDVPNAEELRDDQLEALDRAYATVFAAMTCDPDGLRQFDNGMISMIIPNAPRNPDDSAEARQAATEAVDSDRTCIREAVTMAAAYRLARDIDAPGVFKTFIDYNMNQFHNAVMSIVRDQSLGGAWTCITNTFTSICWLFRFHYIIAIIMDIAFLAIWAIIGGAICRMTALQAARDEKLGPMSALKFSMKKFISFFTAPLIPGIVIVIVALCMLVFSLLGAIPVVGEFLVGIFMGLALIGGFVIALIAIGMIGGTQLMFPTIAAEGSDGFDAISRAFSYLFNRPWHLIFYTLVAAVYGSICYVFVRFFAFLLLLGVHSSVGMAVNLDGSSMLPIQGKFDAMWARPTFETLHAPVNWLALNWSESIGALLICVWAGLIIAMVMAFVVSYAFSVNTIIYLILRKTVDGTDIEDVYVEEDVEALATETAGEETEAAPEDKPKRKSRAKKASADEASDEAPPAEESGEPEEPKE